MVKLDSVSLPYVLRVIRIKKKNSTLKTVSSENYPVSWKTAGEGEVLQLEGEVRYTTAPTEALTFLAMFCGEIERTLDFEDGSPTRQVLFRRLRMQRDVFKPKTMIYSIEIEEVDNPT